MKTKEELAEEHVLSLYGYHCITARISFEAGYDTREEEIDELINLLNEAISYIEEPDLRSVIKLKMMKLKK